MDITKLKEVIKQAGGSDRYSLADVLLALGSTLTEKSARAAILEPPHTIDMTPSVRTLLLFWNLRYDNLSHQSPETINFLHKILIKYL